jgi:hypothetical protein
MNLKIVQSIVGIHRQWNRHQDSPHCCKDHECLPYLFLWCILLEEDVLDRIVLPRSVPNELRIDQWEYHLCNADTRLNQSKVDELSQLEGIGLACNLSCRSYRRYRVEFLPETRIDSFGFVFFERTWPKLYNVPTIGLSKRLAQILPCSSLNDEAVFCPWTKNHSCCTASRFD